MNYNTATKTGRMVVVRDAIDAGTGPGKMKIYTANKAVLIATVTLNDPCGTVSGVILTLSGFPKTVAAIGTGITAVAVLTDSADNVIVDNMTVGTSNAEVIVDNTNINTGQNITVGSGTISHG